MRLQELENKSAPGIEEVKSKTVSVFLASALYSLSGNWEWNMETDAVFCSDVMVSLPDDFAGARAIFHPDDVCLIKDALASSQPIPFLRFRIITSYGEVKTVTGQTITVERDEDGFNVWQDKASESLIHHQQLKKETAHLQTLRQVYEQSNLITSSGCWYYNTATGKTWFDDTVFLLHGLAPQSLNPHVHTFRPFLHPDDKDLAIEYTDKAFRDKAPLHVEYRIVVNENEKWIRYASKWFFNERGEEIFSGVLQDITAYKAGEAEAEAWKNLAQFQKQQVLYDERQVNIGHWQVDLLTRKTTFSDQYYRIFGIKPQSLSAHINAFLRYIHPDDQEAVEALNKKIIHQHAAPDIEYRIQRSDGKLRYVKQTGRLVTIEGNVVLTGILEDVTVQQLLKKKLEDLTRQKANAALQQQQSDEAGRLASWTMDIATGTIEWSHGIYALLGYKTATVQMTLKSFWSFIHPHDLSEFKGHWQLAVQQKHESAFNFRLLQRGAVRYLKAVFRIYTTDEAAIFIGTVQDITGEQVLQEHLAQRVQLAESLTGNILDRVLITDENNTIVLWNKACEKAYGLKSEEAIGQNFFDVFPQLKTETEMALLLKALRGEKVMEEGKRSVTGNGYYNLYMMPLWQHKTVTGILHIVHDVTKETELRNSLQERLLFIESLVESSVDRIIALDRNLNYQYWNSSAEKHYGLSKEKILGKNILDIFPQMVNDPSYGEFRRVVKGETVHIPANPEQKKYFETYLIPVKDERGQVTAILWVAHDLSKELTLGKQLKEHAYYLQRITETVPDMISIMELPSRKVHFLNTESFLLHGFDPGVMAKSSAEELAALIHPHDKHSLEAYYQNLSAATDDAVVTAEYRAKDTGGIWKWFCVRGRVFQRDETGVVTQILNVIEESTKRKKAEEDTRKNMAVLQDAEALAQIGYWEYDLTSGEFRWSEGMYRLFGLSQNNIISPEVYVDFAIEEDRAVAKRIVRNIKKTPQEFQELLCIKRDGELRKLKIKASVVYDENKEAKRLIGVDLDITDIQEVKEKLVRSQRWLEQTARISPDAIVVYDLQKKQPTYLNDCLAKWTQRTNDELWDMGVEGRLQLVHPDDRLRLLHFNEIVAAAQEGKVLTLEYRILSEGDKKTLWLRNRSNVFQRDARGVATHIMSVLQDVTQEKEAEVKLKELNASLALKNKDLENKNDEITSFAFVASHDLKEPLRKMHTFSDWLLTKEEGLSEDGRQSLTRLINSVKRLSTLVDDVVALTKVHAEDERFIKVDLNTVLQKAVAELKDIVESSGAEIQADPLPAVNGLENHLVYLFKNLLSNSLKFQPPGNKPFVRICVSKEAGFIKLSIADNGIGFPMEYGKKIFQMFRRLHGRTEYEGTGMGLAICKKIMEKHGGSIEAESEKENGATFHCWFPAESFTK